MEPPQPHSGGILHFFGGIRRSPTMAEQRRTKLFFGIFILSGTIIGAGVFALPYTIKQAGLFAGILCLIIAFFIVYFIHLCYAEIVLQSKNKERFVGYANKYLGKKASYLAILNSVIEVILVMTIYLVLSESFFKLLGVNRDVGVVLFWALSSWAIFWRLKRISIFETLGLAGIIFIITIIFFYAIFAGLPISKIDITKINLAYVLLPLGPILFSLYGRFGIPVIIDLIKTNDREHTQALTDEATSSINNGSTQDPNQKIAATKPDAIIIKKSVLWGTLLPILIYAMFLFGIWRLSGVVTEDAVTGLISNIPNIMLYLLGLLGIFSLLTTYFLLGLDVRRILVWDLKLPSFIGSLLIIFLPIFAWLIGLRQFIPLINISGNILLPIEGLLILSMAMKIKKLKGQLILFDKNIWRLWYFAVIILISILVYEVTKLFY